MGDLLLDAICEVVGRALANSNMLDDTTLEKDDVNLCLIIKLKNWTNWHLPTKMDQNTDAQVAIGPPETSMKEEMTMKQEVSLADTTELKVDADREPSSVCIDSLLNGERRRSQREKTTLKELKQFIPDSEPDWSPDDDPEEVEEQRKKARKKRRKEKEKAQKEAQKKASAKKEYQCDQCVFKTGDYSNFLRHVKRHSDERPHACHVCDRRFKINYDLKSHIRAIHKGEKRFMCESCDYRCFTISELKIHMLKHSDVKDFSCSVCDFRAKQKGQVRIHEKRVHFDPVQRLQCDKCPFKTIVSLAYRNHVKGHEQNTIFTCAACGLVFYTKQEYRHHYRQKHTELKPIVKVSCSICEKKFRGSSKLRAHMATHTGIKEYRCRYCNTEYALAGSMRKHFRLKHPNETIFFCQLCGFGTNANIEYRRHLNTLSHLQNGSV